MAAFDLEEQEQIATLKAWWDKWGNLITGLAVVLAVGVMGWRSWTWYQTSKAEEASAVYSALLKAAEKGDAQKVREASGLIAEKYAGTAYADLSALLAAKQQAESDRASARTKLEWAAREGHDPLMRDLARLRLAALLADEKKFDDALKVLADKPDEAFRPRFADLRGDILRAQGKASEARAAYKEAYDLLANDEEAAPFKAIVELKLDGLGGAA